MGGYFAVHSRPPAFEGIDGLSYTVALMAAETYEPSAPWGAFLLFVLWSSGDPRVKGHLESGFLATGATEESVLHELGKMPLLDVKKTLDSLIRERNRAGEPRGAGFPGSGGVRSRPWWEVMHDGEESDADE